MTVSYIGTATSSSGGSAGTAISFPIPTGAADGDLLVVYIGICDPTSGSNGSMNIVSGLSDWTSGLNNNLSAGNRQRLRVMYTIYNSASTTATATLGGSSVWVASVSAYRDAGGIGVANVSGNNSSTSGTSIATLTKSPVTSGVDWVSCGFLTNASTGRTWTEDIGSERSDSDSGAATRVMSLSTTDSGPITTGTVITGTHSGAATLGRTACSLVITGTVGGAALTDTRADAEGLTDGLAKALAYGRTQGDAEGLTDAATGVLAYGRPVGDVEGVTDVVARVVGYSRAVADGEGLTDAVAHVIGFGGAAADAEGLTDAVSFEVASEAAAADAEGLSDAVSSILGAGRSPSDAEGITDGVARALGYVRATGDAEGLTDAVGSALAVSLAPLVDTGGLSDSIGWQLDSVENVDLQRGDGVGLTDAVAFRLFGAVTIPPSRMAVVEAEDRVGVVPSEIRIWALPEESRVGLV